MRNLILFLPQNFEAANQLLLRLPDVGPQLTHSYEVPHQLKEEIAAFVCELLKKVD